MAISLREWYSVNESGFEPGMTFDQYFAKVSDHISPGRFPSSEFEAAVKLAWRRGTDPEVFALSMNDEDYSTGGGTMASSNRWATTPEDSGKVNAKSKSMPYNFGREEEPPEPIPPGDVESDIDVDAMDVPNSVSLSDTDVYDASLDYPDSDPYDDDEETRGDSLATVSLGNSPSDIGSDYVGSTHFNDEEPRRPGRANEAVGEINVEKTQQAIKDAGGTANKGTIAKTAQRSQPRTALTKARPGRPSDSFGPKGNNRPTEGVMRLQDYVTEGLESVHEPGDPERDYTYEEAQEIMPREVAELEAVFPDANEITMGTFNIHRASWQDDSFEGAEIFFWPATDDKPWKYDELDGWSKAEDWTAPPPEEPFNDDELDLDGIDDEESELPPDDIANPKNALSEPEDIGELGDDGDGDPDVTLTDDERQLPIRWWGEDDGEEDL